MQIQGHKVTKRRPKSRDRLLYNSSVLVDEKKKLLGCSLTDKLEFISDFKSAKTTKINRKTSPINSRPEFVEKKIFQRFREGTMKKHLQGHLSTKSHIRMTKGPSRDQLTKVSYNLPIDINSSVVGLTTCQKSSILNNSKSGGLSQQIETKGDQNPSQNEAGKRSRNTRRMFRTPIYSSFIEIPKLDSNSKILQFYESKIKRKPTLNNKSPSTSPIVRQIYQIKSRERTPTKQAKMTGSQL